MDGSKRNTAETNQIVYEMSKGSAFFLNAERNDRRTSHRVASMQMKLAQLRKEGLPVKECHLKMQSIEASRDLTRHCVVVDLDMFYAAVEIRDRPELANLPVAIGGTGMISTANYVARKWGVRSAMPGFIGKKLCPDLVFVTPNFDKYREVSAVCREVFRIYDPNCICLSLDEAALDITVSIVFDLW